MPILLDTEGRTRKLQPVTLDFDALEWRDASAFRGAAELTYLKSYIDTGSVSLHVEAIRVAVNDETDCMDAFGGNEGDAGDCQEWLLDLYRIHSAEGHMETVKIGTWDYVVFLSPFCT